MKNELSSRPGSVLDGVGLVVGELAGVDPRSLEFCLEAVFCQENWEGVTVELKHEPPALNCHECHTRTELQDVSRMRCPACGSGNVELVAGQSLRVEWISVK